MDFLSDRIGKLAKLNRRTVEGFFFLKCLSGSHHLSLGRNAPLLLCWSLDCSWTVKTAVSASCLKAAAASVLTCKHG